MSTEKEPYIQKETKASIPTIAVDFFEYWLEPEITRILLYTQHYITNEKKKETITRDNILRELQAECWMPTSLALNLSKAILEKAGYKIQEPKQNHKTPDS